MHELYELKETLCKELEEYGKKGSVSTASLEVVDKLAHTIKNLDKIIESKEEEGYSGRPYYDDGMSRSYRGYAYARGDGRGRGANARRDSMGRYSRGNDMIDQLNDLMEDAPNDRTRQEIQRFIQKMESMV